MFHPKNIKVHKRDKILTLRKHFYREKKKRNSFLIFITPPRILLTALMLTNLMKLCLIHGLKREFIKTLKLTR